MTWSTCGGHHWWCATGAPGELQEGRLLYGADESGRAAFEVRTRSEYFDFLLTQLSEHCATTSSAE